MISRAEVNVAYKLNLAIFLHRLGLRAEVKLGPVIWLNIKKDAYGHLIFDRYNEENG